MHDIPQDDLFQILNEAKKTGKRLEFDSEGRLVFSHGLLINTGFTAKVLEHEEMSKAFESGDSEKIHWTEQYIRAKGWVRDGYGYYEKERRERHNIMPIAGIDNIWNTVFGSTAKSATWYIAAFTSNWNTDGATAALSNWAGAGSGPLATELANAAYDESGRQAATFGTASSGGILTSSAATRYTLATGQTNVSIYGAVLTNIATVAYNATDKILAAATAFDNPITGLAATHKIDLEYSLTGTSS